MSVREKVREMMPAMTAAESRVATALLADYPFSGLLTVAEFGKRASVSGQTILRFSSRLGYPGYGAFQQALISEIKDGYQSPILLREKRGSRHAGESFLVNLSQATARAMEQTAAQIGSVQFDEIAALLSEHKHPVSLLGGRISNSLAYNFFHHLRQIRPRVYKVPAYQEEWPEYLLRMNRRDVVVMFDFRRYQPELLAFARWAARDHGARIVLITDTWLSPIARYSTHILPCVIDVDTPWDTSVPALLLVEALINKVSEADWPRTRKRIESWDALRIGYGLQSADKTLDSPITTPPPTTDD